MFLSSVPISPRIAAPRAARAILAHIKKTYPKIYAQYVAQAGAAPSLHSVKWSDDNGLGDDGGFELSPDLTAGLTTSSSFSLPINTDSSGGGSSLFSSSSGSSSSAASSAGNWISGLVGAVSTGLKDFQSYNQSNQLFDANLNRIATGQRPITAATVNGVATGTVTYAGSGIGIGELAIIGGVLFLFLNQSGRRR